ncbi:hypothetical protein IMX26_00780 [Clostridium sp. 'deep sea']|uniref:hypothetical protein n=1 Tax=Clostridium sp. 'deep sea' TaxID=2779445 RepID=UPI0018964B2A|nr:hypothetical protein [Clostridium sp. 'deep sea']QOR35410.1 hypothetical protein IMX26_00780 [Clostridium sp. 'deep sea']
MKELKRFKSKKNRVYLVEYHGKELVKKQFNNNIKYSIEKKFYINSCFEAISKPQLLKYDDENTTLYLEYINAQTLLTKLEICEANNKIEQAKELLLKLCDYIIQFSNLNYIKKNYLCFNDMNFRNFLVLNNELVAIDFEDICQGLIVNDLIKIVAMYLMYTPQLTHFKTKVADFIKQHIKQILSLSQVEVDMLVKQELELIKVRRDGA